MHLQRTEHVRRQHAFTEAPEQQTISQPNGPKRPSALDPGRRTPATHHAHTQAPEQQHPPRARAVPQHAAPLELCQHRGAQHGGPEHGGPQHRGGAQALLLGVEAACAAVQQALVGGEAARRGDAERRLRAAKGRGIYWDPSLCLIWDPELSHRVPAPLIRLRLGRGMGVTPGDGLELYPDLNTMPESEPSNAPSHPGCSLRSVLRQRLSYARIDEEVGGALALRGSTPDAAARQPAACIAQGKIKQQQSLVVQLEIGKMMKGKRGMLQQRLLQCTAHTLLLSW